VKSIRRHALTTVVVLVVAGCTMPLPVAQSASATASGSPDPSALAAQLRSLVLQADDLAAIGQPAGFQRFDEGPLLLADQPGGARSDPRRFGRLGGWKSRYRRADPTVRSGALVIESRIDVFSDAAGAASELEAAARGTRQGTRIEPNHRSFGDASIALVREEPEPDSVADFTILWRRGTRVASVLISGFRGELSLSEAAVLAERVDARLSAAGG
jgi:hypothetical protein